LIGGPDCYGDVLRDMAGVNVTFSLDPKTVRLRDEAAQRLAKPQSEIVRDAIRANPLESAA